MPTHYAILIGIDDYPEKPLTSCVRDAEDAGAWLGNALEDSISTWVLVAGGDAKRASSFGLTKEHVIRPTYDNVVSVFRNVTSLAKAGNFVYIHYSGHGTREQRDGDSPPEPTGDLGLVLLSDEEIGEVRYLRGVELAFLLKGMVDKGLVITLVLDCCFSASVYRNEDPRVRFLPYDADIGARYPPDPNISLTDDAAQFRQASMLPNWLLSPDRYAIFTACGPREVAIGPKFDGEPHGALSYFLLEAIKKVGLTKRDKDVYNHLCAKFRRSGLPQNPVFYGNRNQGFFGPLNSDVAAADISITMTRSGSLELPVGYAHGICVGDQFLLSPFSYSPEADSRSQGSTVVVKVVRTTALTSDIEQSDGLAIPVRTGWMATALSRLSLRNYPVQLASSLVQRQELLTAFEERSLEVHLDTDGRSFTFGVVLGSDKQYKIHDETGREIAELPSMPQDQTDATQIGGILEHLARFRMTRDLTNTLPVNSFQQSFDVYISATGKLFEPGCLLEVQQGARAELIIRNLGDRDLYVSVYDLGPCWHIEDVFKGTYAVVPPLYQKETRKGGKSMALWMNIPERMKAKGQRSCEDIVKVFVTSWPTSFDLLELPRISERAKDKKGKTVSHGRGEGLENWAAMNFFIRTSL